MSESDKKYLFVCGCPRSGTSALWRLLVSHPDVVMGIERFTNLATKNWSLSPAHFEKDRFMDIQENDTFYSSINNFSSRSGIPALFNSFPEKIGKCKYVGDKLPYLYNRLDGLCEAFPGAHVVYILRNISDVAVSFENRLRDTNDVWKQSAADAVRHWGSSIRKIMNAPEGLNVHVVIYEDLFGDSSNQAEVLFDRLDLPMTEETHAAVSEALKSARLLRMRRNVLPKPSFDTSVLEEAPMHLYETLKTQAIR